MTSLRLQWSWVVVELYRTLEEHLLNANAYYQVGDAVLMCCRRNYYSSENNLNELKVQQNVTVKMQQNLMGVRREYCKKRVL